MLRTRFIAALSFVSIMTLACRDSTGPGDAKNGEVDQLSRQVADSAPHPAGQPGSTPADSASTQPGASHFTGAVWGLQASAPGRDSVVRVAGAEVRIQHQTSGALLASRTSGGDGSFEFVNLSDGTYRLQVNPPAGAPYASNGYSIVVINGKLMTGAGYLNVVLPRK